MKCFYDLDLQDPNQRMITLIAETETEKDLLVRMNLDGVTSGYSKVGMRIDSVNLILQVQPYEVKR